MQIASKGGVIVAGNATRDAEFKLVSDKNTPFAKFGLAVGKGDDGKPIYANVKAWRSLAEYCIGITKGMPVMVLGQVEEREYEGKIYREIVADFVLFTPEQTAAVKPTEQNAVGYNGFTEVSDDDIPDFMK